MDRTAWKIIIYFFIAVFAAKFVVIQIGKSDKYHGKGFTVRIPEGWEKLSDVKKEESTREVKFATLDREVLKDRPEATISILSKYMEQALWIEDEFPSIVRAISDTGLKIVDKGDLKIEDQIAKWVLYDNARADLFNLEFYMITDSKLFFRIRFSANPDNFNKHRPSFEELKESFKLKFM